VSAVMWAGCQVECSLLNVVLEDGIAGQLGTARDDGTLVDEGP
jgi:hypothetical protein